MSEGLPTVRRVIEQVGRIADHHSLLTLWDMTVICRGENKENGEGGEKKKKKKLTVVLQGWSLAGASLMNEKAWIFLLQSARDREWPIAINVDQTKMAPQAAE